MNFDVYNKKIQDISKLLESTNNAENILNNKDLDIKEDFQYICLNSTANYDLVNEVIAMLAQDGNRAIVEENVKIISMSMWKDIFNKNEFTKEIFIKNFNDLYNNTNMITYREIEKFMDDEDVCKLVYAKMEDIIKKLCTYDRAALIKLLNTKSGGQELVKKYLNNFFQKGDFDISTTYSKILVELSKTPGLSRLEILRACNKNFSKMLSRETAVDNETNELLNWIYDAFEENKMDEAEREAIKQNIDKAILENFESILEKSNYDRTTIKVLKQFDCTKDEFEKNKNHFIDKSHEAVILQYNNTEDIVEENSKEELAEAVEGGECLELIDSNEDFDMEFAVNGEESIVSSGKHAQEITTKVCENVEELPQKTEAQPADNISENIDINSNYIEEKVEESIIEENAEELKSEENVQATETYISSKDLINAYINKYNEKVNGDNNTEQISKEDLDEKIKKLIYSNVEETNKIIEKVLKKNANNENQNAIVESTNLDEEKNIELNQNITNVEELAPIQNQNTSVVAEKTTTDTSDETALTITNQDLEELFHEENFFKRVWKKIVNFFKFGFSVNRNRIGE